MKSRFRMLPRWLAGALLGLACAHGQVAPDDWMPEAEQRLRAATVEVRGSDDALCTGFLVNRPDLVVTAAHCVASEQGTSAGAQVVTSRGVRASGQVVAVSPEDDVAVVLLSRALELAPLSLGDSEQTRAGDEILYLGMQLRRRPVQRSEVTLRGACPDFPAVTDAVFASYRGVSGDSGAPLLGRDGVVGIVHGGQRCQIAMPSSRIKPLVLRAIEVARSRVGKR